MYKYILNYEKWLLAQLAREAIDPTLLLAYHKEQIKRMQHERLIHLLVTLFTSFIFIGATIFFYLFPDTIKGLLFFILAILSFFYFLHYYRLENAVQRWYKLAEDLEMQILK